jgi:multidrug efflux pump subunit AcrA (membrane-fusion protein)
MFARAKIHPEIHKDALIIPFKSVVNRGGGTYVFLLNGDIASLQAVQVGITNEREIEVIDGLQEGEEVMVEGHYGMADQIKVRVVRD